MPVKTIKALLPIIKEVQAAFFIYKKAEDKEPFNFGSLISPKECLGKYAIGGPVFYSWMSCGCSLRYLVYTSYR
jgi:hypothetical protein